MGGDEKRTTKWTCSQEERQGWNESHFLSEFLGNNPYSGHLWHILLQSRHFGLLFRKSVSHAVRCAVRRCFEVRWKVLIGASNDELNVEIRPIGADIVLKMSESPRKRGFFFNNFAKKNSTSPLRNLTRLALRCQISTFDPRFDAPGSGFSGALRIKAARHV